MIKFLKIAIIAWVVSWGITAASAQGQSTRYTLGNEFSSELIDSVDFDTNAPIFNDKTPKLYYIRKVKKRYQTHFMDALAEVIRQVEAQAAAMPESLQMNQGKWYDSPTLTEDNVDFFIRYLKNRRSKLKYEWG